MDILTILSVVSVASGYLAFIILELLKSKRRGTERAVANATAGERKRHTGFVVEDDYPPKVASQG